jgi:hypothetical protein
MILCCFISTPANLRLRAKSNKLQQTAAGKEYLTTRNHTDKKENKIFLIYNEIQSGAVAKCKVIYEEGLSNI